MSVVLDASAVLALLWEEPGSDRVEDVMAEAMISAVSQAELVAKLIDRGASLEEAEEVLQVLDLAVVEFDAEQAVVSGDLRRQTRDLGLSLGDRCCLALGKVKALPVLTADRAWAKVSADFKVEVIR